MILKSFAYLFFKNYFSLLCVLVPLLVLGHQLTFSRLTIGQLSLSLYVPSFCVVGSIRDIHQLQFQNSCLGLRKR